MEDGDSSAVPYFPFVQINRNTCLLTPLHVMGVLLHRAKICNDVPMQTELCTMIHDFDLNSKNESIVEKAIIKLKQLLTFASNNG